MTFLRIPKILVSPRMPSWGPLGSPRGVPTEARVGSHGKPAWGPLGSPRGVPWEARVSKCLTGLLDIKSTGKNYPLPPAPCRYEMEGEENFYLQSIKRLTKMLTVMNRRIF